MESYGASERIQAPDELKGSFEAFKGELMKDVHKKLDYIPLYTFPHTRTSTNV